MTTRNIQKNSVSIVLLLMSLILTYVLYVRTSTITNENRLLIKENKELKIKLKSITSKFRNHINKCAFISLDDIQKVSRDGRVITLYFPTAIRKKNFELVNK